MKKKYLILLVLVAFFASCTDKFEEFNTDVKSPTVVPGESILSKAQKSLTDQISSTNVNLNVWKLFAQYWTETTYTDEANYNVINRGVPDLTYREYYTGSDATNSGGFLMDLKEAAKIIGARTPTGAIGDGAKEKANKLAIIELLNVYAYQQLVDIFGNIPYNKALDITNITPSYDDAFTIYKDLLSRVDAALSNLDASGGSFGSADLFYAGNVGKWKKFGNSLKIKLAVNLADYAPAISKAAMEAAAPLAFASGSDDALLVYLSSSPNTNPLYADLVLSGRDDFVPANTIVDIMNNLEDRRRDSYFSNMMDTSSTSVEKLAYVGGIYGVPSDIADYSHIADGIQEATFHGIIMTYDEVLFYLAEGAARGFNVGGTAKDLYESAISASFDFWGADSVDLYLANPDVAYNTAAGTWKEKIGTQEWIAFYTRGLEGYTSWRRLDFPVLNIPPTITNYSDIPKRFTYPVNEQTLNKANYESAAAAIGGDDLLTRIFWDTADPVAPVK
jgi:hypothetical protein